ncbi:MAG: hypothetical protein IJD97_04535 [Clostridia bacterium]|nr:hypothetical protein [Clostridia bacterium]
MWKCPNCGQKNRIDTCTKCGTEKSSSPKGSISSLNFIIMAILSIAIIIGIFFAVDTAIDYKKRQESYNYQEEITEEPFVAPVTEQTAE